MISVLLADDQALVRAGFRALLNAEPDIQVVAEAADGLEAVKQAQQTHPDVVLMDIRMPEMDGHTALAELRKIPGTELLPVIAVTASSMIDDEQVLRGYFAGYIRKPFTRQMLFHELAAFLPRRARVVPAAPAEPAKTAVAPRVAAKQSPELLQALRRMEAGRWREVSDSGAISEVKDFAQRLVAITGSSSCPPLREYSTALLQDAEEYAILRMEQRLKDFPALVRSLEIADAQASSTTSAALN